MLATGVTDVHRRSLVLLAQNVATLDQLSGGRAVLGIGRGEVMNLDPFEIPWDRPVARTLEAVEVMKRLWDEESPFDYQGEFYNIIEGWLQIPPAQKPHPPIYHASQSPATYPLTGKYFDGWYPAMESPALYKEAYDMVKKGAEDAGRTIDEIDCGVQIITSISDDPDEALATAMKSRYMVGAVPIKLKRAGYDVPGLDDYDDYFFFNELVVTKKGQEKFFGAAEYITEEMVEDFMLIGTVDDCIGKIEKYIDIGLNQLVIHNLGPDKEKTIEYFQGEIIPYFSDR